MSNSIVPFDFYVLRLPVLPLSDLTQLHAAQREPAALAAALHALYQAPAMQEAIYLASPELHQELGKWLAKPLDPQAGVDERLLLTLYKYVLRMSSRSTPYGQFAGFSTGALAAQPTQWQLEEPARRAHKHARLDMNYVAELSKQLAADPVLKTQLKFFVNTSLYKVKNTYRYYECRVRNKRRHYYLVALQASVYIDQLVTAAQPGASYAHLLGLLTQAGVAQGKATVFLDQLLDSQILVSELEPTVTGPEFYQCLLAKVAELCPHHPQLAALREIQALLTPSHARTAAYQAVQGILARSFPAATSKDLIQNDLRLNMVHNVLNNKAVKELSAELQDLTALSHAKAPADLQAFIHDFTERYEAQEIPLLEALDGEAGVGYGPASGSKANHTPFIADVRVVAKPTAPRVAWTAYRQLVFRKFQEGHQLGAAPVRLTEADLAALTQEQAVALPPTFFAMGSFLAASAAALDAGEFKFHLMTCNGPGAMPVLARFAHADAGLADKLRACGQHEQQAHGEVLLAEVVHLPEARVGNLLQRPQLRPYEIPFLGNASVPLDQQIPVSDLLVSVQQGRVVLRSKRLNQQVLPRLTSAHNYRKGLTIYKFLCDLQQQQTPFSILWDWGQLAAQAYLPRVEYKRIIVSRAQWRLPAAAHREVAALRTPAEQAAFLQRYCLPRQVLLTEADNELLLDFDCPLAFALLAQRLKKGVAVLHEFVHDAASRLLQDDQQRGYLHEVILPFASTTPAAPAVVRRAAPVPSAVQRSFAPGSEWTYLKVYCGTKWGDKILTDYLLPCLEKLQAQDLLHKWFFIRYADPKNHLRLRFLHAPDPAHVAAIMAGVHQALAGLQQERIVQAIQYDTYHREIERYGAATMELSETVFYHDSQAVLHFLNLLEGDEGERYRWLFAIRGADELLTAFGLSLAEKAALAEQLHQAFFQEFNGDAGLVRQLNDKYRTVSRELTGFLDPANDTPYIEDAVTVFAVRAAALRGAYADWLALAGPVATASQVRRLLPSYLHMFLNRIFLASQRLHELVVYHHLAKHYKSVAARQKHLSLAEH